MSKPERRHLVVAASFSLAVGACASFSPASAPGPSPRADCPTTHNVLYFQEDAATLSPSASPILREIMEQISACRTAGGDVQRIIVVAYPDRSAGRQEGNTSIQERANMVRDALISAGAPAARIRIERPRSSSETGQIMQSRAEIEVRQR